MEVWRWLITPEPHSELTFILDRTSGVLITAAYFGLAFLMAYYWRVYQRIVPVHAGIWLPFTMLFLSAALRSWTTTFELELCDVNGFDVIIRMSLAVTSWATLYSLYQMRSKLEAVK